MICFVSAATVQAGPQQATEDANPHGKVEITHPDGKTTFIDQDSQEAIINWQRFDVGAEEAVNFDQPGSGARALNRVVGDHPSDIRGNLTANGQIYLVNPAGIMFGPDATVNAAKLYAAAGHLSNENFLAGKDLFTDLEGTVENLGQLKGTGVHLLGRRVKNVGTIDAADGVITMTSADDVLLGTRDGHVFAKIKDAGRPTGEDGAAVTNEGTVDAGDGSVRMSAGDLFATSIFNDGGTVEGDEVELAGGDGTTLASGTIDASTDQAGEEGGSIEVLGEKVGLFDATLTADGPAGGGTINVGGSKKGKGPLPNAQQAVVTSDVEVSADATQNGDGGTAIVWSDGSTTSYGTLSATGGPEGGDGGFVEVSGADLDTALRRVDVTAPGGDSGTALFDPSSIELRSGTSDGEDSGDALSNELDGGTNQGEILFSDPDDTSVDANNGNLVVFESEIENETANNGTDIVLQATDEVFNSDSFDLSISSSDLDVETRNGSGDGSGGINLSGMSISGTGGSISVTAGTDGGAAGTANLVVDGISSGGGDVKLASEGTMSMDGTLNAGSGDVRLEAGGQVTQTSEILASGLELLGTGPVTLTNSANNVSTIAGRLTGTGASLRYVDDAGMDVGVVNTAGLSTDSGAIDLTAEANSGAGDIAMNRSVSTGNNNLTLDAAGTITQGGSGDISAGGLQLISGGNVTLTNSSNAVDLLAADTTSSAGNRIAYTDTDGLTVSSLTDLAGTTTSGISTDDAAITVRSAVGSRGDLTVNDAASGDDVVSTGSTGRILLQAAGDDNAIVLNSGASVAGNGANLTFRADDMDLSGTVSGGSAIVTLEPNQTGEAIDLGTTSGPNDNDGTLELSSAELDAAAGTLRVGDITSGAMSVLAGVSASNASTLSLLTGAGITDNSGSGTVSVSSGSGSLRIDADNGVSLTGSNDVATLGAVVSGAGEPLTYNDTDGLSTGTVDGTSGVTTNDGAIDLTAGGNNNTLTVTAGSGVASNGSGNDTADVTLTADEMDLNAGVSATDDDVVLLPVNAGEAFNLGASDTTNDTVELGGTDLGNVTADTLRVGDTSSGAFTVSSAVAPSGIDTLTLRSDEGVGISGGGALTVGSPAGSGNLRVDVDTAVSLPNANNVNNLTVDISEAGNPLRFNDDDSFTAGTVDGQSGITATGRMNLTADDGITAARDISANTSTATVTASTINTDDNADGTGRLDVADGVSLNTSNGPLDVTADDLDLNSTGSIDTGTGALTMTVSDNDNLGLGQTAEPFHVSGGELADVTSGSLTLNLDVTAGTAQATIDGITAGPSDSTGPVTVDVDDDTGTVTNGSIVLANHASTFSDSVTLDANATIDVNQNLTSANGAISLDSNLDSNASETGQDVRVADGVTIDAATDVEFFPTGAQDTRAEGSMTVNAGDNIVINTDFTGGSADATDEVALNPGNQLTLNDDVQLNLLGVEAPDLDVNGAVSLGAASQEIDADGSSSDGSIHISGIVNGASDLTVFSDSADTTFQRPVGGSTALASLTVNGADTLTLDDVTTSSSQEYTARQIILNSTYTATGTPGVNDTISFSGPVTLNSDTTINQQGGENTDDVVFGSSATVDGDGNGPWSLTIDVASDGDLDLQADAGGAQPLGGLFVGTADDVNLNTVQTTGVTKANGSGNTIDVGSISSISGPLTLNGDLDTSAAGPGAATGGIRLNVNGSSDVDLATDVAVTTDDRGFDGGTGAAADGSVNIAGGSIDGQGTNGFAFDAGSGSLTLPSPRNVTHLVALREGAVSITGTTTNDVDTLAAKTDGSLTFEDRDGLTIGTAEGVAGIDTNGHDVTISTASSASGSNSTSTTLTLGDGSTAPAEDIVATGATVTLSADADIQGGADDTSAEIEAGVIDLNSNQDASNDNGAIGGTTPIDLIATTRLNADASNQGADIDLDTLADVTIGELTTGTSGGGSVRLDSTGHIRHDGDAADDVVGDTVTLTADTDGIGTQASPVDVNVQTAFNADTTADAGGVFVDSPNKDLLVDAVDARGAGTSGDVVLRSGDTVESSADDSGVEVDATNLGIVAGDGIGNETPFFPNQSDQVLETTVDTLNARESSGAYIEIDNRGDVELTNAVLGLNTTASISDTGGGNTIITAASDATINSPVDVTGNFYTSVTDDITVNASVTADDNVGLRADADGSADSGDGSIFHNSGQIRADDDTNGNGGVLLAGHNIELDAAGNSPDVIADGTFGSETPPEGNFGVAVLAQDDLRINNQITSNAGTSGHIILQSDADLNDADAGGAIDITTWPDPLNDDPSTAAADDGYGEAADQTGGLTFNTSGSTEKARVDASGGISMVSGDEIRVVASGMTFEADAALDRTGNNDDLHASAGFAAIAAGSVDLSPNSGNVSINVNDPTVFEAGRDFSGFSSVDREDFAVTSSTNDPGATLNLGGINLSGGPLEINQAPSVTLGGTYSVPWVHVESTAGSIEVKPGTVLETEERDTFSSNTHDTPYGILLDAAANVTINDNTTTFDTDRDDDGTQQDIGIGAGGTVSVSGRLGTDSLTANPPAQILNANNIVIGDTTAAGDRLDNEPDSISVTSTGILRANSINMDSNGSAGVTLAGTIEAVDSSGSLDINTSTSGAISQTGGKIDVSGTTSLAAGSSNNVSLPERDNDFNDDNSGSSTVSVTSAKNVTVSDEDSLPLGAVTTTGGDLDVDTSGEVEVLGAVDVDGAANVNTAGNGGPGGPINDGGGSGSLVVEERTTLTAGTTTSTFDISLVNGGANDFDENGSGDELIITRAASVSIDDIDDLTLGDADVRGDMDVDSGAATTLIGTVKVAGDADINTTENGAGGPITQTGGNFTVEGATNLVAGSGNDISLTQTDNDVDASDSGSALTIGSADSVSIDDEDNVTLGGSTISGDLDLDTSGFVDVVGTVDVEGNADVDTDKNGGTGGMITDSGGHLEVINTADGDRETTTLDAVDEDIVLDRASNNFDVLSITDANDAEVQEADGVTLDTVLVDGGGGGNGNLVLKAASSSGGAIDDVTGSAIRVVGNADIANDAMGSADITLGDDSTDAVNVGTLTLNSDGTATMIENSSTAFTGTSRVSALDLTSFGAITDTPGASLAVDNNATFDNTVVTGDILLGDQPGDTVNFGTLTFTSGGDVTITENSDMAIVGGPNTGVDVRLKVLSSMNIGGAGVDADGDIIASATEDVIADADVLADRDIIVRADDDASASPTRGAFVHREGLVEADTNNDSDGGILVAGHNIELDPSGGTTADNLETSGIVASTDNPPRGIGDDPTAIALLASNNITIREDVDANTGGGQNSHVVINADADLSSVDDAWPSPIAGTADGPAPDGAGTVTVESGVSGTDTAGSALDLAAAGAVQFAGVNVDFLSNGPDVNVEGNATVDRSDSGDDYHGPASLTVFAEEDITAGTRTTLTSDAGNLLVKADYEFDQVSHRPELGIPAGDGNSSGIVSLNGTLDSDDGIEVFAGTGASNVANAFGDWVHVDVDGSLSVNSSSDIEGEFTDANGAADNHVPATIELDAGAALTINDGVDLDADRVNDGVGTGEGLVALGAGTTMTINGGVGTDSGGSDDQARAILLGDTGNARLNTPEEIVIGASFSDEITATENVTAEANSTSGIGISINDYRIESQNDSVDLEADANGTSAGTFTLTGDSRIVADADNSATGPSVAIHGQTVTLNAETSATPTDNPELQAGDLIDVDSDTSISIGTAATTETDLSTESGHIELTAHGGAITQNDGAILAGSRVDIDSAGAAGAGFEQDASAGNSTFATTDDAIQGTRVTVDSDSGIEIGSTSSDDAIESTVTGIALTATGGDITHTGSGNVEASGGGDLLLTATDSVNNQNVEFTSAATVHTTSTGEGDVRIDANNRVDQSNTAHEIIARGDVEIGQASDPTDVTTVEHSGLIEADSNDSGAHDVLINATGAITQDSDPSSIIRSGSVSGSGTGGVRITSSGGPVTLRNVQSDGENQISAQGSLPSGNLAITVEGNSITMADGNVDVNSTGNGDVELFADSGRVEVGDVNAGGNSVFIESATDEVVDADSDSASPVTDVTAINIGIKANSGIGDTDGNHNDGEVLETAASVLNAHNTGSNNIEIDNSGALTLSDSPLNVNGSSNEGVRNDGGQVVFTTASPMTVSSDVQASTDAYLVADGILTIDANVDARSGNVGVRSVRDDLFQDSGRIEADGGGVLIAADDDVILDRTGDGKTTTSVSADSMFTTSVNPPGVDAGIAVLGGGDVTVNTRLNTTGGTNRHIIAQADTEFSNADGIGGAALENTWPDPLNDDPATPGTTGDGAGSPSDGAGNVFFNTGSSVRGAAISSAGGVSINAADDVRVKQNGMAIDADGVIDRSSENLHGERAVAVLTEEHIDVLASNGTPSTINTVDASDDGENGVELVADYDFGSISDSNREVAGVNDQSSDGNSGGVEINGRINTSGLADWSGGDVEVTTTGGDVRVDNIIASGGADGADADSDGAGAGNITLVPDADTSTAPGGYETPDGLVTLTGDLRANGGAPSGSGSAGSGGVITIGPATRNENAIGVASIEGTGTAGRLEITASGAAGTGRIEIGEDEKFTSLGTTGTTGDGDLLLAATGQVEMGDVVVDGRLDVRGGGRGDVVFHTRNADDLLRSNGSVVTDQGMDVVARGAIRFDGVDQLTPVDISGAGEGDPQFASLTPRDISPRLLNNYVIRSLETVPGLTRGMTVLDARSTGPLFGLGNKLRETLPSRQRLPGVPSFIRPEGLPEGVHAMTMPRPIEGDTAGPDMDAPARRFDLTNMYDEYSSNRSWGLQLVEPWELFREAVENQE